MCGVVKTAEIAGRGRRHYGGLSISIWNRRGGERETGGEERGLCFLRLSLKIEFLIGSGPVMKQNKVNKTQQLIRLLLGEIPTPWQQSSVNIQLGHLTRSSVTYASTRPVHKPSDSLTGPQRRRFGRFPHKIL